MKNKYAVGDYLQLSESARYMLATSWKSISATDRKYLESHRRLHVRDVNDYGDCFFDGVSVPFDVCNLEPFEIDYDGPCPFVVGDKIRLRNISDYKPIPNDSVQSVVIAQLGFEPFVIDSIIAGSIYSAARGINGRDWRRFEYADDECTETQDMKLMLPGSVKCQVGSRARQSSTGLVGLVVRSSGTVRDVVIYDERNTFTINELEETTDPVSVKPSSTVRREVRCGACSTRESLDMLPAMFEGGGYFSYPTSRVPRPAGHKQRHDCEYGMQLCPACARSVAEHIMFLKVNHGPTRTGRT